MLFNFKAGAGRSKEKDNEKSPLDTGSALAEFCWSKRLGYAGWPCLRLGRFRVMRVEA